MGKKRKVKETIPEPPQLQTDVAKDIDDIFAARKQRSTAPTIPKPLGSGDVEKSTRKSTANSLGTDFVSVGKQVQDAKSKLNTATSHTTRDDEFADLRGTNKSIIFCYFDGC